MLDKITFFLIIIVLCFGCGIFYDHPTPITFGCMVGDIYIAIFMLAIEVVDRIERKR